MRSKILVHTHRNLAGSDIEAVMLEHLLLLILISHLVTRLSRIKILYRLFKVYITHLLFLFCYILKIYRHVSSHTYSKV